MRAHIIKDGAVVNTVIVDALDSMPGLIPADVGGTIGDLWDGGKIISQRPPQAEPVPDSITPRQCQLQLDNLGLLETVETAIAGMHKPARIEWAKASEIKRNHPLVQQMRQLLGWSQKQMDEYFIAAAKL